MNYPQTLDYLYNKLPMFSRMGSAAFKKDLTNTIRLCEALGNPHQKFKSIHVGGTNGKGSVSHMLAAIFQNAGYKTGLYTSPHLYDFRERIRINGEMIPNTFVVDFVKTMKPHIEKTEPSFFEITVAMAFEAFAEEKVDIAIVEVGLGGRLDSTNIILPELSVITNIGWDHMNMLGNTLPEIAFEKAGIIKPGVPVVIGEVLPETRPVLTAVAKEHHADIVFAEEHFTTMRYQMQTRALEAVYRHRTGKEMVVRSDLPGIYQLQNIRTVLTAVRLLQEKGYALDDNTIRTGLQTTKATTRLLGRWQVIRQQPLVVLEVAHNRDGIEQMLRHLAQLSYGRLHLVIGMVKDKDIKQVLSLLPKSAAYYFTQAAIPRALPAADLKKTAETFALNGSDYDNVNDAVSAAISHAMANDIILVCGSIFLVAEVDTKQFDEPDFPL